MTAQSLQPYLSAGEENAVRSLGAPTIVRATGENTRGAFGLVEQFNVPPGYATPYHVHHLEDESFYVLEGEVAIVFDGQWTTAGAGSFAFGPREIPHGYKVVGSAQARLLVLATPAGFERFAMEMSEPMTAAPGPPDMARLAATAAKYQIDILGPLPE